MSKLSIVDAQIVRRHPANNSPSKIAHQFSKSKRFPQMNPQCPNAFYTYDSQLSNRRTSFGYGTKCDFTRPTNVSPPSTKYSQKSIFEDSKKRGKSFGLSRQVSPDRSYLIPQLHKNPGPGKYDNEKYQNNNLSYTMRPKTLDVIDKCNTSKYSPPPTQYNTIDLEPKNGRFSYAKYSDIQFGTLNLTSERFAKIKQLPGPSSYIQKDGLSNTAKYLLSNHKGNGTRVFNQTARFNRQKWTNLDNPGPGNYQKPSDFGVYGDSKYYKTLTNFTK